VRRFARLSAVSVVLIQTGKFVRGVHAMSDVSLEEGYCPKCGERKVMTKIKEDGTSYQFCKACDWNNKTVSLEELLKKYREQLKNLNLSKIAVEVGLENDAKKIAKDVIAKDVRWNLICVQMNMIAGFLKDFEVFVAGLRKLRKDFPSTTVSFEDWHDVTEYLRKLEYCLKRLDAQLGDKEH